MTSKLKHGSLDFIKFDYFKYFATFLRFLPSMSMDDSVNWDKVVEDIGPRLFRYFCVRFTKEQADDLTQETLIRLVRKVKDKQFNPDKGTLKMLSFGIAHYVALESRQLESHDSIEDWTDRLQGIYF